MKIAVIETKNDVYKEMLARTGKKFMSAIAAKRVFASVDDIMAEGAINLDPPSVLKNIEVASNMLCEKIKTAPDEIVVHGDYDCDGLTSCYIVSMFLLEKFNIKVSTYVNHREKEGYGLTESVVEKLYKNGARFILTVDNGITSMEAAIKAKELGMTLVITDHHEPKIDKDGNDILPCADVIVNHKIKGGSTKKIDLCGAGTAFFLCRAIDEEIAIRYIDAAGLATVVDMVSMAEKNNRIMVKESIRLAKNGSFSTKTLESLFLAVVGNTSEISEETYGFSIGPVVNASGRMSMAQEFLALYTKEGANKEDFAGFCEINTKRKEITSIFFSKIDKAAKEQSVRQKFIAIVGNNIPEGIVGLIASKVEQKYLMPTIIMTKKEDGTIKGSGRARNMNLQLLHSHEHSHKIKGGGHKSACGVSLNGADLDYLLAVLASIEIEDPIIRVDAEIKPEMIGEGLIEELSMLSPYGQDFPKPLFAVNVEKNGEVKMLKGKHFSYRESGRNFIMFNAEESSNIDESMTKGSFIGRISMNSFAGRKTPQMIIDRVTSWS